MRLPLPSQFLAITHHHQRHHYRHHLHMASFVSSSSSGAVHKPTVLLVSSSADSASVNLATALSNTLLWTQPAPERPSLYEGTDDALNCRLYMWRQEQPLLHLDEPHKLIEQTLAHAVTFDEVLFLSKHSAASGKASLTAHPIGIPWMADAGMYGGAPGKCSPPSPRIASLYRALVAKAADNKAAAGALPFDVTMEATHHGPYVSIPTGFLEIGSTDNEWDVPELGQFWADLLLEHFTAPIAAKNRGGGVVAMSIGGGHYVPKLNDIARFGEGMYTGHALASYTLQGYFDGTVDAPVADGWQAVVTEAVTRCGFDNVLLSLSVSIPSNVNLHTCAFTTLSLPPLTPPPQHPQSAPGGAVRRPDRQKSLWRREPARDRSPARRARRRVDAHRQRGQENVRRMGAFFFAQCRGCAAGLGGGRRHWEVASRPVEFASSFSFFFLLRMKHVNSTRRRKIDHEKQKKWSIKKASICGRRHSAAAAQASLCGPSGAPNRRTRPRPLRGPWGPPPAPRGPPPRPDTPRRRHGARRSTRCCPGERGRRRGRGARR